MNMCCISLSDIKDIILILSSVITVSLALFGLKKWKKQFKLQQYNESARLLMKSLYSLRDNFDYVRSTFIAANEFPPNYNPKESKQSECDHYIYSNRLKYLNEAYSTLLSILPEVEVTFGKTVRDECNKFGGILFEYQDTLSEYLQLINETILNDRIIAIRKTINMQTKDDLFREKYINLIESIEDKVKIYLKF